MFGGSQSSTFSFNRGNSSSLFGNNNNNNSANSLFGQRSTRNSNQSSGFGATSTNEQRTDGLVPITPLEFDDSVSSLAWSEVSEDVLAVGAWDGQVKIFDCSNIHKAQEVQKFNPHKAPILDTIFGGNMDVVLTGSADSTVVATAAETGKEIQLKLPNDETAHQAPVKCLTLAGDGNSFVSGSWDKSICLWSGDTLETRITVKDRVYALAARREFVLVACANRHIQLYDVRNPSVPVKESFSPLKFQTRSVALSLDCSWFAVTSIEGRCAVVHVDDAKRRENFTFRCHRENDSIYSVNDVHFHPKTGAFATFGNDRSFSIWDKDSRHRLKMHKLKTKTGLIQGRFNKSGNTLAVASAYDWSQGPSRYIAESSVWLYKPPTADVTPMSRR